MLGSFIRLLNLVNQKIGRAVSWLALLLVLITVLDVSLRYFFKSGSIAVQELEWHLFSALFLLAAGYTLQLDGHVRVDIFYARMRPRVQALVNTLGGVLFLLPFCVLAIYSSIDFVLASVSPYIEHSPDPGGLPCRFLVKSLIPLGFLLLLIQGVAHTLENAAILCGKEKTSKDS